MEHKDRVITDANQRRVHNRQFDVLRLLAYLAHCFCSEKRCVAAVLGESRMKMRSAEDEELSNDDESDDNGDGNNNNDNNNNDNDDAYFSNISKGLNTELSSASDIQAEYDDSVDYFHTTPPPSPNKAPKPSEACLVLHLADNWSPSIPPYFGQRSSLVKKNLYECIHLPDDTHRWYWLIVLG